MRFDRSAVHRHAIFTVHDEKCYMCDTPLDMQSFQVEHLIPESLEGQELASALAQVGRRSDFDLQGFENLMPACGRCNRLKADRPWGSSLQVQMLLQKAAEKAPDVIATVEQMRRNNSVARAVGVLQRASEEGPLHPSHSQAIRDLLSFQIHMRKPSLKEQPLRVSKQLVLQVSEEPSTKSVTIAWQGPVTLSLRPEGAQVSGAFICKACGGRQFAGTTCLDCGLEN